MRPRPEGRYKDKNGFVNVGLLMSEPYREYPAAVKWDIAYKAECDRMATLIAGRYKRNWGRWYLENRYLCTVDTRPGIGGGADYKGGEYYIALNRVDTKYGEKGNGYSWIKHISDKNWIGKQGLDDLKRAFDCLIESGEIK